MTNEKRNEIAYRLQHALNDAEHTQESLIYSMRRLAENLVRSADNLAAHDLNTINTSDYRGLPINTLGEVQSHGTDIDRQCGELKAQLDAYKNMKALVDMIERN